MKNTIKYITYATLLSFSLVSCLEFDDPVEDQPEAVESSGQADFSTFVALGDSLTAGFSDGSLYIDGQEVSFANLMAIQMEAAGGSEFTTPFMNDNIGGFVELEDTFPKRLVFDAINRVPVRIEGESTTSPLDILTGPFSNMGIPGAKSFHLGLDGYGTLNPYFGRFASSLGTNVLTDALAQSPTFFNLWIGNNDVLSYAVSGGTGVNQLGNLDATTYGNDDITDPNLFSIVYNSIVQTLTIGGAEGLLVNIPSVTSLPFFNTVPHNPVPLDATTAAVLNSDAAYGAYNQGLLDVEALGILSASERERRTISFSESTTNAVVIFDESLTDLTAINPALTNMRQATAEDLLVLTASSFIGTLAIEGDENTANGVAVPLSDMWVLTPEEQAEIATATEAFNTTIAGLAEERGLAFYDANARTEELSTNGITINGSTVTNEFATGGFFSLDGIHLSPKANGIIANEMIEVINETYGSTLTPTNTRDLPTIFIQ